MVVATTLRTTQWEGMFGNYHFDNTNAIIGRDIYIKKVLYERARFVFDNLPTQTAAEGELVIAPSQLSSRAAS